MAHLSVPSAIDKSLRHLEATQRADGSWDYPLESPVFLTSLYVLAMYALGDAIPQPEAEEIKKYFRQRLLNNGSLVFYRDAKEPSLFTTVLSYVALRLLGEPAHQPLLCKMRQWMLAHGSALASASWAKHFLAFLNLYDYQGLPPVLPEVWLLPRWLPLSPKNMWCYIRTVYLPFSYLYRRQARCPLTPLLEEIRTEIFPVPYSEVRFSDYLNTVADCDSLYPMRGVLKHAFRQMQWLQHFIPQTLTQASLREVMLQIDYEETSSDYLCLHSVNDILNPLVFHFAGANKERVDRAKAAWKGYLRQTEEGLFFQGSTTSTLWDCAFIMQILHELRKNEAVLPIAERAFQYIANDQIADELENPRRFYRNERNKGGWAFGDSKRRWPASDCTASGLQVALLWNPLLGEQPGRAIPEERVLAAIDCILSLQNRDGGWPAHEKSRAGRWLEVLNPTNVFCDLMIDYSHVECSGECLRALSAARDLYPSRRDQIDRAVRRGVRFISRHQQPHGGFVGFWGVCFTCATWFAVKAWLSCGIPAGDERIQKAIAFLKEHQNSNGSWGEQLSSCYTRRWENLDEGCAVNTAWALLTLMEAGLVESSAVARGIEFLLKTQQSHGVWPKNRIVGAFNRTSGLDYHGYFAYFPLWALARYEALTTAS